MDTTIVSVIIEAFSYPFFTRALAIGGLISFASAILGIYVVLRKEALIGHTISDVSFLGIAIGLLLGLNLSAITIAIAMTAAIFIVAVQSYGKFSHDSVLAFTAEISLAIAIFIISRLEGYRVDVSQYLFGDILGISRSDVTVAVALMPLILVALFLARNKILQVTFSEELSISAGTNIFFYNALFTMLVAITIAVGIKIVGIILMAAFLIIPANIAKIVARSFAETVFLSAGAALLATFLGLIMSYVLDAPSGAMIVMSLGGMLFATIIVKRILSPVFSLL